MSEYTTPDPFFLFSFPTTQFLSLVEPELRFWFTQTIQFISGYWTSREVGIDLMIKEHKLVITPT